MMTIGGLKTVGPGSGSSPTYSGNITAQRFISSLTGDVGTMFGFLGGASGMGSDNAGAGNIAFYVSSSVQWRINGATGDLVSPLSRNINNGAGSVTSASFVCAGTSTAFRAAAVGGTWSNSLGGTWMVNTAPTISSGFGTSPSIPANNGTAAFTVNVGTGGTASSGVIALPPAHAGWALTVRNLTTNSATVFYTKQTATTTTTATIANYDAAGAVQPWAASDVLLITAVGY